MNHPLPQRLVAEAVGTAMLLAAIVGSGIMGERLAAGNIAIALLANSIATGGALIALILAFGPISGAHLNPVVTLAIAWRRGLFWHEVLPYILVQIAGAVAGVVIAHLMFGLPLVSASQHVRDGSSQMFSEAVASFGLLAVIFVSPSSVRPEAIAAMREIGIDISRHRSKSVDEFIDHEFDYVITVCDNAREQCPFFGGRAKQIHWGFDDPAAAEGDELARLAVFRRVRDEIKEHLRLSVG